MIAGAINHISALPLQRRERALENYVLSQFGFNLTQNDFDDIRRSVGALRLAACTDATI